MVNNTGTDAVLSPQELMNLQVGALFTYDSNGRTLTLDEPWDGHRPAPRFYLGRTVDGKIVVRFRHDVEDTLAAELEQIAKDEPAAAVFDCEETEFRGLPKFRDKYLQLLGQKEYSAGPCWLVAAGARAPNCSEAGAGGLAGPEKSISILITRDNIDQFKLDSQIKPEKGFEWLRDEIDTAEPCAGLIIEGRLVSQCRSVRRSPKAHEAGLETLPDYRGRGYAAIVTAGWAAAVRDLGALPFYTTSWNNTGSRSVARKLGLYYYGNSFSVY
ncbi:MAG: GNAT family N-acetyltransferase [Treponema sp.]|nr:GNAT family N-acetyltransferase [Treponema sp.]